MGPGIHDRVSPVMCRALAGIETGILGGLAMAGWMAVSSLLDLRSIWIVPNLLGSTLLGSPVLQRGFGWLTVTGIGLHLFVAGLIGLVFGLAVGDFRRRLRVVLFGLLAAMIWYYFSQALFWRKLGAFVTLYSPPRPMLLGHLVYGLVLGWFPSGLQSLRRSLLESPAVSETHETAAAPDTVE